MSPTFRSVRSRVTTITTLLVGVALAVAGVGMLTISRRSLVDDVRGALAGNVAGARDLLNESVATDITLLQLGQEIDPAEITLDPVEEACSSILTEAYGRVIRPFSTYLEVGDLDPVATAAYEECVAGRSMEVRTVEVCRDEAVAALGDPEVTFAEFGRLLESQSFREAYDDCTADLLDAPARIAAAAGTCDPALDDPFREVDVLDSEQVDDRLRDVLAGYADCMRDNGVPEYPSLTVATGAGDLSVLSGGGGASVVLPSLETVRAGVDRFGTTVAIVVPLLVADLAVLTWFMVARALRPVEAIRTQVERIRGGELDRRVPESGSGDEIDRLAVTINRMLDRLEGAIERQQQFVSDASHELRSPLASIRAQLEVAMAHPDRADWRDVASGVLEEGSRMEALVADLLALARADEGALADHDETVDLAALARAEAADRPGPIRFDVAAPVPVTVRGDAGALRRVIRNLLDNAARHAAGRVVVTVSAEPGGVLLAVEDDGAGIPPEDRERVFERFTRLEEARTRDAGGTGLGLAVVGEVVGAHRGTAVVTDGALGGARFEIRLP